MKRKPTLLLVFVHGFKGDDGTFGDLVEHLQALVQNARPNHNVAVQVYPQYETRGDLASCVSRFREWLQDVIIDLEVAAGTPSPTVDPSVHTVLIGHSMGGIVIADTFLSIIDDRPVAGSAIMFPHIVGILAFDTPYLGLAPSMFAHGAEGNLKTASSVFSTVSSVAGGLFATQTAVKDDAVAAIESADQNDRKGRSSPKTPQGGWGWGKIAAIGGVAATLAGGAAAAYMHSDKLGAGYSWVSSHLEFVGALMKGEELKKRVERASTHDGVGFANLFTSLGSKPAVSSFYEGKERTFCSIPVQYSPLRKKFFRCINQKANDEVGAHVGMFTAKENDGYFELVERAKGLIVLWVAEDAWVVEYDSEEEGQKHKSHRPKKSSSKSSSRTHSYDENPKLERRASSKTEERRGSRHGSPWEPERRSSRHGSPWESEVSERRGSPRELERRSSAYDTEKLERRSSRQGSPRELERRNTVYETEKLERRESKSGPPMELERRSTYAAGEMERRSSRHEVETLERRSSRHGASRTNSFEPEKLERRDSRPKDERRSSKSSKSSSRGLAIQDLDHNPWR